MSSLFISKSSPSVSSFSFIIIIYFSSSASTTSLFCISFCVFFLFFCLLFVYRHYIIWCVLFFVCVVGLVALSGGTREREYFFIQTKKEKSGDHTYGFSRCVISEWGWVMFPHLHFLILNSIINSINTISTSNDNQNDMFVATASAMRFKFCLRVCFGGMFFFLNSLLIQWWVSKKRRVACRIE